MDIFALLDQIQAIARTGLHYTANPYDQERYEQLLHLTTQTYSHLLTIPEGTIKKRFLDEVGYITPKIGADAAIFNANGELLLMERADGSGWCLPCGWVEPNEKPSQTVVREVFEETGLHVKIKQLIGVFTRMPSAEAGPHTMVAIVHWCEVIGGELTLSHEGSALRYWPIADVPYWHPNHNKYAKVAHKMWETDYLLPSVSD